MPARVIAAADAVKTLINTGLAPSPNATRVYAPGYKTAKEKDRRVVVVPGTDRSSEILDRESWTESNTVHIAVYEKLPASAGDGSTEAANTVADAAIELAEKIYDLFDPGQDIGDYHLKSVDHQNVFIPSILREHGVLVSIVALQFETP